MSGRTEHLERELKLRAAPEMELPPLQGVTSAVALLPPQQLRATYYDTSDLRLFGRGVSFRYREDEEPGTRTWTLKLPNKAGGQVVQRKEISWSGSAAIIPEEARGILRGIVRHSELKPVVGITTTRRRLSLQDAYGTTWAELNDDVAAVCGSTEDGLRFRQIELELSAEIEGRTARVLFKEVVQRLLEAGARPETESKLAKALGPATAGSVPEREPRIGGRATVADVVRFSTASALDRILTHDVLLRLSPSEPAPADVHQARVATRRLRSDLKTFTPVLDPVWVRHVRDDLRWAGSVLGRVRDADVLVNRLGLLSDTDEGDDAGRRQLRERLAEQRRHAATDLAAMLGEERYLRLLDRLHAASSRPPLLVRQAGGDEQPGPGPADLARQALPGLIARSWRPLGKRARKAARRHPTDRELHQVRIKAKQIRYASEAAAPAMGRPAQRTARAAKELQAVLGDHHDAVTAEAWLADEARQPVPEAAFAAGLLTAEQRRLQKKWRRRWKASWHNLEASAGWLRHSKR